MPRKPEHTRTIERSLLTILTRDFNQTSKEARKPDASRCFHEQWQHLGLWDLAGMLHHVAPLVCRWGWLVRKRSIRLRYKYQKIHFTYIHMQSHHATFWDGSSCSTCLVPLQSWLKHLVACAGTCWMEYEAHEVFLTQLLPLQVFTHLCLNHVANYAFSKFAFQGCWLSSSARKMNRTLRVLRPELPPSRALKLSSKETLIRHSQAAPWLFRLCGAQMTVPWQK